MKNVVQKGKFVQNVHLVLFYRDKLAKHSVIWGIIKVKIKFVNLAKLQIVKLVIPLESYAPSVNQISLNKITIVNKNVIWVSLLIKTKCANPVKIKSALNVNLLINV